MLLYSIIVENNSITILFENDVRYQTVFDSSFCNQPPHEYSKKVQTIYLSLELSPIQNTEIRQLKFFCYLYILALLICFFNYFCKMYNPIIILPGIISKLVLNRVYFCQYLCCWVKFMNHLEYFRSNSDLCYVQSLKKYVKKEYV